MKSKVSYEVFKQANEKQISRNSLGSTRSSRVISFTSGKGGVGKTSIACNVGLALTQLGNRVLLIDADLSLANVDVVLGLTPKGTIRHVVEGHANFKDILLSTPEGLDIIPASSGFESLAQLTGEQKLMLRDQVDSIASDYDYILIDTAAGIGSDVLFFNTASHEIVCVVNGEPTSLTDAYALIKVLSTRFGEKSISILVNNVLDAAEADRTFSRLRGAVERFLQGNIKSLGFVPTDGRVREAVQGRAAFQSAYPSSQASLAVAKIAKALDSGFYEPRVKGGLQFLFDKLLEAGAKA